MAYTSKHWKIYELVSPIVYKVWGERAWMFFDEDIVRDLDTIREEAGEALIINDWFWNGTYDDSGLRSNLDPIFKGKKTLYLSGHVLAKAFDIKTKNPANIKKLYNLIFNLIKSKKLRKFKRLEDPKTATTWVHTDAMEVDNAPVVFKA